MTKSGKHIESDTYTNIGNIHWREAKKRYYTPGLHTTAISAQMFGKKGTPRMIRDDKNHRQMLVTFDREYVYERILRTILNPLNIVCDGEIDEELYDLLFTGLREYISTSSDRTRQEQLRLEAERLHEQFPHKTVEQWLLELNPQCNELATTDTSNELTATNAVDEPCNTTAADVHVQGDSSNIVKPDDAIDYDTWGMNNDTVSQESAIPNEQTDELTTTTGFESMNYDLSDSDDSEPSSNDGETGVEKPDVDSVVTVVPGRQDVIALSSPDSSEPGKAVPRKRGRPRKSS
ncbi:MAG: hypothetical protein RM021_008520 [Nostoc sp. EkiNYC01]|nr:hypothetical protein [Nostoc sp. EkiNYC01]